MHDPTLSQEDNGIADVKLVNSHGGALSTPDLSLTIYQQQMMLNHQMFLQQQQTVNALTGKVEGLAKIVNNRESAGKSDKSPRVSELKQTKSKMGNPTNTFCPILTLRTFPQTRRNREIETIARGMNQTVMTVERKKNRRVNKRNRAPK